MYKFTFAVNNHSKGGFMQGVNEKVLTSWLKMILSVDGERVASQLPYNEAVVCNLLLDNPDVDIS